MVLVGAVRRLPAPMLALTQKWPSKPQRTMLHSRKGAKQVPRLTVIRTGKRHVLGINGAQYEIWQTGHFRRRLATAFDDTQEGYDAAQARFSEFEPESMIEPPPGRQVNLRKFTWISVASVVTAIVLIAGSVGLIAVRGGANMNPDSAAQSVVNWVGTDSGLAVMLEWTRAGDTLTGSLIASDLASTGGTSLQSVDQAFTGVINGDGATLTFPSWFDTTTNIAARVQGLDIVLSFPQSSGGVHVLTLIPGTVATYNKDVANLQRTVDSNAQASASASAAATDQQAAAQQAAAAEQQKAQDTQAVQDDLTTLSQDSKLSSDTSTLAADLKKTDSDLAMTRQDAAAGSGDNCVNASSTVYNDAASTVYNDAVSSFSNDVGSLAAGY